MFFPLAEPIWNWEGVSICRRRWLPPPSFFHHFSYQIPIISASYCENEWFPAVSWWQWHGPHNFRVCNWSNLLICFKNYCHFLGKLWICFMCASSACRACCSFSTVIFCLSDRVKLLIAFQWGSSWVLWGCLSFFLYLFSLRSVLPSIWVYGGLPCLCRCVSFRWDWWI